MNSFVPDRVRMQTALRSMLAMLLLFNFTIFTSNTALAANATVSQGYTTATEVKAGTLVSRDPSSSQSVVLSDGNNQNLLAGVIVNPEDSLVAYYTTNSKVQVATGGVVLINASTINGEIHTGDRLTSSPIAGVAMKATQSGKIVGVAQADLLSNSSGVENQTIKDRSGKESDVAVGQVAVSVGVTDWTSGDSGQRNGFLDSVQTMAQTVTGRDVAPVRAIIAALLILIAMLISAIILYSSISSSIRSIGRNPLSHSMIKRSLLLVIVVVLLIMIAAFTISYIIIGR